MFSRFRQINKNDNMHLEVRAYDEEGNSFNSLEGFKFDWVIVSGHDNIMRISSKDAGHNKAHPHQAEVASGNDDDFFLKALKSGITEIQVKILEPGHDQVAPAAIKLTIVEPFVILPDFDRSEQAIENPFGVTPYILPTSEFYFKLSYLIMTSDRGVDFMDIKIPSDQYAWTVDSQPVLGMIAKDGLFQSLTKPGKVDLKVVDQRFPNNTAETDIFVVEPFSLQLDFADVTEEYARLGSKLENKKDSISLFSRQLNVSEWAQ